MAKMLELQGPELLAPHDPNIELNESGWVAVPGTPGQGVDTDEIVAELPAAAARRRRRGRRPAHPDRGRPGRGRTPLHRRRGPGAGRPGQRHDGQRADADRRRRVQAGRRGHAAELDRPHHRRGRPRPGHPPRQGERGGRRDLLRPVGRAQDASFDLQNGTPVVVPSQQGVVCCGPTSPDLVWQALDGGTGTAALEVQVTEPELTTEAAQGLGITQPVGGNHAWRNGSPTTAGPGFTTYHDCCEAAGDQHPPHGRHRPRHGRSCRARRSRSTSIVGPRTSRTASSTAGAIHNGEHVEEVGGGVSQFATTMFNAAFFAGLDFPEYQAHCEYFYRYPSGARPRWASRTPTSSSRTTRPTAS